MLLSFANCQICRKLNGEGGMVSGTGQVFKVQIASLLQHQPSGISEAYAAAYGLCGEEGHKDTLSRLGRYGLTVVAAKI